METFAIKDFSFTYPEQTKKAIDRLNLRVLPGEFLVLCGPSGCGKSTLLRQLKTVLSPHGRREGEIFFEGKPLASYDQREQASRIGFVQQNPENQIVTDKVWHELAFGLESLGADTPTIRRRVAEMASFFGLENWMYQDVADLSGGQKQLLNLASVMVLHPDVLVLDEPTSQLDPIAASEFLNTLSKINRELGTTIVLTEHRLEEAFALAGRVAVLDEGRLIAEGTPAHVGESLKEMGHSMFLAMPTAMRIWAAADNGFSCPVTVREGRDWLRNFENDLGPVPEEPRYTYPEVPAIEAEELWFRYEKDSPDVVRGLTLQVKEGEFFALLGGNGAGKSTSLKLLAGLNKPTRGKFSVRGSLAMLPQNPRTLFVKKTVREDFMEMFRGRKKEAAEMESSIARVVSLCRLQDLLDRHPYDLSGGEQQRAALAKVLLLEPRILLMDEPTKGLDAEFKETFASILKVLLRAGVTILMVSHDVEFCARYAHRCALFFDGNIVTEGPPRTFFSGNNFYTTSANRMARHLLPEAVTPEDVIFALGGKLPPEKELPPDDFILPPAPETREKEERKALPLWRKLLGAVSALISLAIFVFAVDMKDLRAVIGSEGLSRASLDQLRVYGLFLLSLLAFVLCVSRKNNRAEAWYEAAPEKRKLSKRTVLSAALILLFIPLTLFVGEAFLDGRKYYFISLLILFEIMCPFFLVFESRKPQARELILIAVLCAIAVAGRAAFFMLPNFKPVLALTIIAGVAFGGETGFLVGAMTMLASNVMFSQGPWTPWQMFAMGIIGFFAGVLFRKGLLRRSRVALSAFGFLMAVVVYGLIMNTASGLLALNTVTWKTLLPYYIAGFPMDMIHGASTFIFLWLGAEPMLEKLDRIKVKYGLVQAG